MSDYLKFNEFIVDIFNRILKIEQTALMAGLDENISITEVHIIDKIGEFGEIKMSMLASELSVTLATVAVACDKLENKGFIQKIKDTTDKRVVRISLTPKGFVVKKYHDKFHEEMSRAALADLTDEERSAIIKGVEKLKAFFINETEKNI